MMSPTLMSLNLSDVQTALQALRDLFGVVFESLQRTQCARVHHDAIADHADAVVSVNASVLDQATCDGAHLGNLERLADFSCTHNALLDLGRQQAFHGLLHLFDGLVDDGVHPNLDAFLLCELPCRSAWAHLETDDDGF